MSFTDIFIKRPVLSSVISLIILLMGVVSYRSLAVREFPFIETSAISIRVAYPGASAKLMEGFVTTPIESAISSADGIDYVTSQSTQGETQITIYLKQGYSIDVAINDVSQKVGSVRNKLPTDIKDPVITKQDPNANPILFISFNSKQMSSEEVTDYLVRVIRPELETIQGVGQAMIFGERAYSMRIWMHPGLLAAHHLTPLDVVNRLRDNNVQSTAGRMTLRSEEFNVNAKTDLNDAEHFNRVVLKQEQGSLIRIQDIGEAQLGPSSVRSSLYIGGKQSVVIGIVPKSTANPLDISKIVHQRFDKLQKRLPLDMKASIDWDASKFISESIHEVYKTVIEACLFVLLVIYLFLGSLRAVIIPAVTIPLSLLGICTLMNSLNFTINTITLLAWVLAIGLVVDDAIVVLENIHRHIEEGLSKFDAAIKGAREIRFAIISMTFTLAAVYAPIAFSEGLTGILFREFALVLAGSVVLSGIIALTLSPMLCSKVLAEKSEENKFEEKVNHIFQIIKTHYRFRLRWILQRGYLVFLSLIAVFLVLIGLWKILPQELAPMEDQGVVMGIAFAPTAASLAYTERYTKEILDIYKQVPERENDVLINGYPNGVRSAMSFLILKPWSERKRSTTEIVQSLFPQMWSIPGILAFPVEFPPLPSTGENNPVEFVIKSNLDYPELYRAIETVKQEAQKNPKLLNPDTNLKLDKPELLIDIDRNKAADLGITMNDINATLAFALAEPDVSRFSIKGRSYDVIPQFYEAFRNYPDALNRIYIKSNNDELIPFANIASMSRKLVPESLPHFQQLRSATLTANLAPGYTLGQALDYLQKIVQEKIPSDIQFDFSGQSRQFIEASGTLMQVFILAVIFIYLVLAAQFESFRDPIIVMMTVPLSIAGGLFVLFLAGGTINIYTQIGLVTLIGLITKHGILMVEFANQLLRSGVATTKKSAIVQAASIRLRPILMTTATMLLGALPLVIASGAGAASRNQIGWVIIGGMSFGTMLTLFVIPTIYLKLAKK